MEYTPFEKPFNELDEPQLNRLIDKEITEGWYIEFKSDFSRTKGGANIDSSKIAKTISAFANTRGGYYIVGVTTSNNKASLINGIEIPPDVNVEDQLSRIITSNITPTPFFQLKTIVLESGKKVIVIIVEEGTTPPYITSQGIIYQRENNESSPVRDRYIIEKLAEKTNSYEKKIDNFCNFDYTVSKAQAEWSQSFLEVYLFPIPFNVPRFKDNFYTPEFFKNVADTFFDGSSFTFKLTDGYEKRISLTMGFNSIQTSPDHLLLRPINSDNVIDKHIAAELHVNGAFKFTFPIPEFDVTNAPDYYTESEVLKHILDKYCPIRTVTKTGGQYGLQGASDVYEYETEEREPNNFSGFVKAIDGAEVILRILLFVNFYKSLLEENKQSFEGLFGLRARATNLWRKFLFFDNADYLEKIKKYNLPICPFRDVEIPRFTRGKYYQLDLKDNSMLFDIHELILEGIGLPEPSTMKFVEILKNRLDRFDNVKNYNT